ncbi:unnamed protein product [Caenorhabditis auriculariae]|uniref:G-protein coupled receptors family 1 profile domain-containing protein n=1 Tax=Caenorhabditis auriculariae TaxID=2777116 RepID=A0A8S1H5F3_9PELO|nr:unnamed protein product [Caenorhabditis auriculariae]
MEDETGVCGYTEEVTTARFVYISLGGVVAFFGCVSNALLFLLLTTRKLPNSPPQLYPAALALLDGLLCSFFIMIFVVDVNMIYNRSEELFVLFHRYIIFTFCAAKLVQFLIPYMLMLGTLERYTWICSKKRKLAILQPKFRPFTLGGLLLGATALRIPSALALTVTEFPDCEDFFRTLAVDESAWYMIYDVYVIGCLQTFFPFFMLMLLNLVIVNRLAKIDAEKRQPLTEIKVETPTMSRRRSLRVLTSLRIHKMPASVRNAIYTMVTIVATYLISNSLHIILTLLEVTKASVLVDENDHYKASLLYTVLGDSVSLLYMTSSAVRIVIYVSCNPAIRKQFLSMRFPGYYRKR